MVQDDYTTDKELAERWLTKAEAREKATADLKLNDKYTADECKKYAMRIAHAVEAALENKHQPLTETLEEQHKHERKIGFLLCFFKGCLFRDSYPFLKAFLGVPILFKGLF